MSYNDEDLAFQQRVRGVLEQKALLGGRRGSRRRKHSKSGSGLLSGGRRSRKHSKKGRGISGGVLSGGRKSRKHKRGYGTLTGGSTAAQRKAAAHARAVKRSKHKRVRFGRGYDEPMEGGYRQKRRSSMKYRRGRGVGGALTREEIDKLLSEPTPELARDYVEADKIRTKNPAQDLETVYADVITDLQIKQDRSSIDIMRKIQELQNSLDFQNMKYQQDAERVAEAFAQAKASEMRAIGRSQKLLEDAQKRITKAQTTYDTIRKYSSEERLVPTPGFYTSGGIPVYALGDKGDTYKYYDPSISAEDQAAYAEYEAKRKFAPDAFSKLLLGYKPPGSSGSTA